MLGGMKTALADGHDLAGREEIWKRISARPEGDLFRAEDIIGDRPDLVDDFVALRGYDYMHVSDGWLVGIVETKYLRRMPNLKLGMAAYAKLRDCALVETGDWVAWRSKIKQWEPLLGHRYYTDGADEFLAYGRYMTIRIINAPDWLRAEDETSRLLRAFHDTPEKEFAEAMTRARTIAQISEDRLLDVAERARDLGPLRHEEIAHWPWLRCPQAIAEDIETWIENDRKERAA